MLSRFEVSSALAVLAEQADGIEEMESSLVEFAGMSIETSETERSDSEARLNCEGLQVVRLGTVGFVQRLVGRTESKVSVMGLVGERGEFQRAEVVTDGRLGVFLSSVDQSAVVVGFGIAVAG